ncbi:MAG TPA: hypothetical protein DEO73_08585 [Pantoea sp.]|nr:hypothetical protein [Pantoea sp.]
MKVLSHRGYWQDVAEKNMDVAFERSFSLGFGTETDIRDYMGQLVISHDIPNGEALSFKEMLRIYAEYNKHNNMPLALNIKSDGLQEKLMCTLQEFNIENYFVFDMSIPDTLGYLKNACKTFVRYSEFEDLNELYNFAHGVWLDGFNKDLVNEDFLKKILSDNKSVCIVSPDLHKRPNIDMWTKLKNMSSEIVSSEKIMICTDVPEEAEEFFNGK